MDTDPHSQESPPELSPIAPSSQDVFLANDKLRREIAKLDLEAEKLRRDIDESKRTYLWRNPQVLPAAIAAFGAIIGIGVATYVNYWTMVKQQADFASQDAKRQQEVAAIQRKDAEQLKTEADTIRSKAEETKKQAEEIIATETQKIADVQERSKAESQRAILATKQADEAMIRLTSLDVFRLSGLPPVVYKQQDQLRLLGLVNLPSETYAWITSKNLKALFFGSTAPNDEINASSLSTMPSSVEVLGIDSYRASDIDVQHLKSVATLRWLDVRAWGNDSDPAGVRHLGLLRNLKVLKLKLPRGKPSGLEEVSELRNLKQLSLTVDNAAQIPRNVLGQFTSLAMYGARPIDEAPITEAEYALLAKSGYLRMLSIPGKITTSGWTLLQKARASKR
jgi:hypothetical protein